MDSKKTYIFLIIVTIICGTFLSWKFCCNASVETTTPILVEETKPVVTPIKKAVGGILITEPKGNFTYSHTDHINFAPSSSKIISPVSANVNLGIEKLKDYLITFPNKTISIIGFYKKDEVYTGALKDLGIARATATKNYLVGKGISSKQIDLYSQIKEKLTIVDSVYKGPLSFEINERKGNAEDEVAKLKTKIQANPLVVYFNTGQSNITLTELQKQKIADISKYLDKTTDKKAIVTGHTDNVGDEKTNTVLGQKRAEFVKSYLINNGISVSKIITKSKGPLEPIESNNTAEGRSKNRRTVIAIN